MADKKTQAITLLFSAYGQKGDSQRMALYIKMLSKLDESVLVAVTEKAIESKKFLPSIAEILEMADSLKTTITGECVPSWAEAWGEIQKAMLRTPWDKKPTFSHPAIKEAVECYGWYDLQRVLSDDLPTVRAQLRRMYDECVARYKEDAQNAKLIAKNPKLQELANSVRLLQ